MYNGEPPPRRWGLFWFNSGQNLFSFGGFSKLKVFYNLCVQLTKRSTEMSNRKACFFLFGSNNNNIRKIYKFCEAIYSLSNKDESKCCCFFLIFVKNKVLQTIENLP